MKKGKLFLIIGIILTAVFYTVNFVVIAIQMPQYTTKRRIKNSDLSEFGEIIKILQEPSNGVVSIIDKKYVEYRGWSDYLRERTYSKTVKYKHYEWCGDESMEVDAIKNDLYDFMKKNKIWRIDVFNEPQMIEFQFISFLEDGRSVIYSEEDESSVRAYKEQLTQSETSGYGVIHEFTHLDEFLYFCETWCID